MLKYRPTTLVVDQTILCNQECLFCWRNDANLVRRTAAEHPDRTMPMDTFQEIVSQGARHGLRVLSLCGPMGEPTMVPDLVDRGLFAKSKRFHVSINTNGYLLHRHANLRQAFDKITVSLDSLNPARYAASHGKPHHAQVVKNIEDLMRQPGAGDVRVKFTAASGAHEEVAPIRGWTVARKDVHSFIDVVGGAKGSAARCNQPHGAVNYNYRGEMTTCCLNYKMAPTFGHIRNGMRVCWEGAEFEAWRKTRLEGLCRGCSGLGEAQNYRKVQA